MSDKEEFQLIKSTTIFLRDNQTLAKKIIYNLLSGENFSVTLTSNEISKSIDKEILIKMDEELQFKYPLVKNFFIEFQLISEIGVSDTFFENAIASSRQSKKLYQVSKEQIIILNNVFQISVSSQIASAQKDLFWRIFHPYCKALVFLDLNTEHFVNGLLNIVQHTENDFAVGEIYSSLGKLGKLQLTTTEKIVEAILASNEVKLLSFIPTLFEGLSCVLGADLMFDRATSLIDNSNIEYQKIGILSIAFLKYDESPNSETLLKRSRKILDGMLDVSNTALLPVIAQTYGHLVPKIPSALEQLTVISKSNDPQTLYTLTVVLSKVEFSANNEWCEHLVYELAKVKPEHKGILDNISYWLDDRIKDQSHLILGFFERWIMFDHNKPQDIENFKNLFNQIPAINKSFLWNLITKWLLEDRIKFQLVLAVLLREYHLQGIKELQLDISIIKKLTFETIKVLIFRILGFVINKEYLETLTYSILEHAGQTKEVRQLIISAYVQYIVYNYPSAIDYLREKQRNATAYQLMAISEIIRYWNRYIREHKKLPRLNEFKSSDDRQIAYSKMQSKIFSRDFQSNEQGFLSSLFRSVDLKGGKNMFMKTKEGYSQKSTLAVIEAKGELPRGEFIDPVGQAKLRFYWKTMERK